MDHFSDKVIWLLASDTSVIAEHEYEARCHNAGRTEIEVTVSGISPMSYAAFVACIMHAEAHNNSIMHHFLLSGLSVL